ncbi:MAG: hypothetical protein BGO32_01535 [Bacteroidetes bacterium 37-13]|nr:MAG: hypothetical protein BGO32_01535 [Bacteroidetes bacterium 37-13]
MVSVTTSLGAVTTNTTSAEIVTTFSENSNKFWFENGSSGGGTYTLSKNNGITITVQRGDFGGWPNGPWLDLYLEVMNIAKSYKIDNDQLLIETSDKRKVLFTKL